jgi:uncharacterized protein
MKTETVLITGASSGIGLHLAHEFARNGHPLILVARIEAELHTVARVFETQYGVQVRFFGKDLEQPEAAQQILDQLREQGVDVDILVNNAGHGSCDRWWHVPIEKDISMIRLNIEAVLRLTKLFLPSMVRRKRGRILNTASMIAFEPSPLMATYAATKAFVLSWSEALAVELENSGVSVTALCPGVTDTDFFEKAGAENIRARQSSNVMAPQDVAKAGYDAMMAGELFVIPGGMNKALIAARRVLPVTTQAKMNRKQNEEVPPEHRQRVRGDEEEVHAVQVG